MTSPVDTSVKFFHSGMASAPTINGVAGSLVAALDACLVNGWGSKTLTSLIVAGGIATATFTGGAGPWEQDAVVEIAGVTGGLTALNGEQRVLSATNTTLTFATAASDGTAAGTITVKLAPAGWEKRFAATNKGVYRSLDGASTLCNMRVDDSATLTANIIGYETMSDFDTGTGRFPTIAQSSTGNYVRKSSAASATANSWVIVADARTVYICVATHFNSAATYYNHNVACFGDLVSDKSPDPFACLYSFFGTSLTSRNGHMGDTEDNFSDTSFSYVARDFSGLGSAVSVSKLTNNIRTNARSGHSDYGSPYPNPVNNGLFMSPLGLYQGTTTNYFRRGIAPGIYHVPQYTRASFTNLNRVPGVGAFSGKRFLVVTSGSVEVPMPNLTAGGIVLFDVSSAWR